MVEMHIDETLLTASLKSNFLIYETNVFWAENTQYKLHMVL